MSDVTLFQQGLPDYLKEVELDDMTKALSGGGAQSKRISVRGGVFRLMVGNKEVAKNENRAMNVVIVNGSPKIGRTFYAGAYDASNPASPDCWSADGEKPDASIEAPQHSNCQDCPQNIKGSGQGDSRACRYKQRLAVLLADDVNGDVYGLELAATSLFGNSKDVNKMPFQQYAKYVGSQNKNINTLVTEMRLDSDSATPKLVFKPVRFLTREEWMASVEKGNTIEAKQAVTLSFQKKEEQAALSAPQQDSTSEPTKRVSKRAAAAPTEKKDLSDIMNKWTTDDE
jgi:hypothetical protein